MSNVFVNSRAGAAKKTCDKCGRNTRVVTIAGVPIALDTELIAVVTTQARHPERINVHRVHGELCERYKLEAEKKAYALEQRKAHKAFKTETEVVCPPAEIRKRLLANYAAVAKVKRRSFRGGL